MESELFFDFVYKTDTASSLKKCFLFNNRISKASLLSGINGSEFIKVLEERLKTEYEKNTTLIVSNLLNSSKGGDEKSLLRYLYLKKVIAYQDRCKYQPALDIFFYYPLGHCAVVGPINGNSTNIDLPAYGTIGSWFFPRFIFILENIKENVLGIRRFYRFNKTEIMKYCDNPEMPITIDISKSLLLRDEIKNAYDTALRIDKTNEENVDKISGLLQKKCFQESKFESDILDCIKNESSIIYDYAYLVDPVGQLVDSCKSKENHILDYYLSSLTLLNKHMTKKDSPLFKSFLGKLSLFVPLLWPVYALRSASTPQQILADYQLYLETLRILFKCYIELLNEAKDKNTLSNWFTLVTLSINFIADRLKLTDKVQPGQTILSYNRDSLNFIHGIAFNSETTAIWIDFASKLTSQGCFAINPMFLRDKVPKLSNTTILKSQLQESAFIKKSDEGKQGSIDSPDKPEVLQIPPKTSQTLKASGIFQISRDDFFGYGFNMDTSFWIIDTDKLLYNDIGALFNKLSLTRLDQSQTETRKWPTWKYFANESDYSIEKIRQNGTLDESIIPHLEKYLKESIEIDDKEKPLWNILYTWIVSTYCYTIFAEHPIITLEADSNENIKIIIASVAKACFNGNCFIGLKDFSILSRASSFQQTLAIEEIDRKNIVDQRGPLYSSILRGNIVDWSKSAMNDDLTFFCPKIIHSEFFLKNERDLGVYTIKLALNRHGMRYTGRTEGKSIQAIKDHLYSYVLSKLPEIRKNYKDNEYFKTYGIKQIWQPLFAVGRVMGIDNDLLEYYQGKTKNARTILEDNESVQVFVTFLKYAKRKCEGHYFYKDLMAKYNSRFNKEVTNRSFFTGILNGNGLDYIHQVEDKLKDKKIKKNEKQFEIRTRKAYLGKKVGLKNPDYACYLDKELLEKCIHDLIQDLVNKGKYKDFHEIMTVINQEINQDPLPELEDSLLQ